MHSISLEIKLIKRKGERLLVLFRQCRTTSHDPEHDHMISTPLVTDSNILEFHMDGTRNCRLLVTQRDTRGHDFVLVVR